MVVLACALGAGWLPSSPAARAQSSPAPGAELAALADEIVVTDELLGLRGDEAVEVLADTDTTDIVADNADMSVAELVDELRSDESLFVTADGLVGYEERMPADEALESPTAASSLEAAALVPSNVFALNSRPSSTKVIYLDFDGHVTPPGGWNDGRSITSAPYATAASATTAQRAAIFEIWQRVAEDYLPFDINVTTRDPGVDGLRKTSDTDQAFGQRMVISPTNWTGDNNSLGIALLSVFSAPVDYSSFVFTQQLSTAGIAEAASHEAGHTFGLRHDGTAQSEYYLGHGSWKPIMGNPIDGAVTQWSLGEYSGANNREDDLVEIAAHTGLRPDDRPGTAASASLVGAASMTRGEIGVSGDVDVFLVDVAAGPLSVTLGPELAAGSNLAAQVRVRDQSGVIVGTGRPTTPVGWSSTVSTTVATPGRYSIEVSSVGYLSPLNTGFSRYGSMGAYMLTVAGVSPDPAPPPPVPSTTSRFTEVTPARLLDTRSGLGGSFWVGPGEQIVLQVAGRHGVPLGASAAVVNVVAVDPSDDGYISAFPCVFPRPRTSSVNFVRGQVVGNTTIAALSDSGQLCLWSSAETDIVVDVTGWLGVDGAAKYTPSGPSRVADTRTGFGGSNRLGPGQTMSVDLGALPAGTSAAALNVVAVGASAPGHLTVFPCGVTRPTTATVNYVANEVRPNNTIVGLGNGRVCIYSVAATDVVVDFVGYMNPNGDLSYRASAPVRLIDTRSLGSPVVGKQAVSYSAATSRLIAEVADAASVSVAAVDHRVPGYVTTYDCVTRNKTATVNQQVGEVNANGAIVPLRANSSSCFWMSDGGHLVIDLNGWWVR